MVGLNDFMENRQYEREYVVAEVADFHDIPKGLPGHVPEGTKGKRPTYGVGRLKLRIPGLTDMKQEGPNGEPFIEDEDLPWAYQMSSLGTGTKNGVGSFSVPEKGTKVVCKKVNEYGWVVIGELNSKDHDISDFHENYPHTHGKKDKSGNKTIINTEKGTYLFQHSSGSSVSFGKSGSLKTKIVDDFNFDISENKKEKIGGHIEEKIGEHKKSSIGDFQEVSVSGYYKGTYSSTYQENVSGAYTGTFSGNFFTTIAGGYTQNVGSGWNVTVAGSSNFSTSGYTINSPTTTINGDLIVTGKIISQTEVEAPGGIKLTQHKHPGTSKPIP